MGAGDISAHFVRNGARGYQYSLNGRMWAGSNSFNANPFPPQTHTRTHTHTHTSKVYYFSDTILLVQGLATFRIRVTHFTFNVIIRGSLSGVHVKILTKERLGCKKNKHKI